MTDRLRVAVLFGGRSGEHEVSLMSARSVLAVLDPAKYEVTQIGITREGKWLTGDDVLGRFEKNQIEGLLHAIISPDPSERGVFVA
jgi:D-alanine-D-alanine ligase